MFDGASANGDFARRMAKDMLAVVSKKLEFLHLEGAQ
jgi:hypothetical protein